MAVSAPAWPAPPSPHANVNAMANFQQGFMSALVQGEFEEINDRNHFPGHLCPGQLEGQSPPDPGLRRALGRYSLHGTTRSASRPHSAPPSMRPTRARPNSRLPQHRELQDCLPAWCSRATPGFPEERREVTSTSRFMPRVGFAYDVFGDGKTALRGGYGIFFQDRMPGFFNLSQSTFAPNTITVTLTNLDQTAGSPGGPLSNPYCTGCTAGRTPIRSRSPCHSSPRRYSRTRWRSTSTILPATSRSRSPTTTT